MIYRFKLLILLSFFVNLDAHFIKVLLYQLPLEEQQEIVCASQDSMYVFTPDAEQSYLLNSQVTVRMQQGAMYLNQKKIDCNKLLLRTLSSSTIVCNNNEYHGDIIIIKQPNALLVINKVLLEDYIYCVLNTESWPTWTLEAHKVMAVAVRTYALFKILASKRKSLPYHIKSSNHHQTYAGTHTKTILRQAVDETKGIIMTFDRKPIEAMFDSCCGGVIPAQVHHFNHKAIPYLCREYACTYCKDFKIFNWTFNVPSQQLVAAIKQHVPRIKRISALTVTKRDKAGLAQQIVIYDGRLKYALTGKQFYSLFSNIKSYCYDIAKNNEHFLFTGKGYGHHIGLCQWGASKMVTLGNTFKQTLEFFYPGIKFMKISEKLR